ncbi:MAG: adenylosuccinate lyase [Dictyoglomi bacterium]|nr:adenylosuccinate lyase [Dictyoglomota bacterium]
MIARYSDKTIEKIWNLHNKFSKMLEIEILALEGLASIGKVPPDVPARVRENARFTVEEILEEEKKTRHDVVAFVNVVSRYIGDDAKYFHKGLTSSDVLDTAFVLLNLESLDYMENIWKDMLDVLYKLAQKYKHVPQIGRTHGIHAEPMTLGLKLLGYHYEGLRVLEALQNVKKSIAYVKLSGAVGTYANLPPEVEDYVASKLGLKRFMPATQVISRDVFADIVWAMAKLMSALKRWSINFRLMDLTEILEVQEPFYKGQTGSSAMPHKKNPISWERITGLARVVQSYVNVALENNALWFERDISHSSTERIIFPDMYHVAAYTTKLMTKLLKDIRVNEKYLKRNLEYLRGLVFAGRLLVALMDKGYVREEAYKIVQSLSMQVWENETLHLKNLVKEHLSHIFSDKEIEHIFDVDDYLRYIDYVFDTYKVEHQL